MQTLDKHQTELVAGARLIKHPPVTTMAVGEEGGTVTTMIYGEEGGTVTTMMVGEEGSPIAASNTTTTTSALGSF